MVASACNLSSLRLLRRLRKRNFEFEASLSYITRPYFKNKNLERKRKKERKTKHYAK
jgi:hypothetical protein